LETDETDGMKPPPDPHYRHRFPAEIISQAVWLYHVFSLSLRDVELLLAERGVVASYETIRRWCKKFGQTFAGRLRRRRPRPGDKWYLDEVFIRIQGVRTICGAPWIRRALCSTSSFSHGGMPKQQSVSSDGC
jgi:putative transposase